MKKKVQMIGCLLAAAGLALIVYIFLHEFGHCIVMLSAGATIDDFSILTAHVSGTGGEYTDFSRMWMHANGALLPLLAAYAWMLFYRSGSKKTFYRLFSYVFGLIPTTSLLVWVFIPFLYMSGNAPAVEDATKFLNDFSQAFHPLTVSAAAAIMIGTGIVLMVKKRIVQNFIAEIRGGEA